MRSGSKRRSVAVAACLLLLACAAGSPAAVARASPTLAATTGVQYPTTSWALGVVAPEGASLEGGATLHWEEVTNVTVLVNLPNISLPDGAVYAVVSVMMGDGCVLQAAAGILPKQTDWLVYSMSIPDADSVPPTYQRGLNESAPQMPPTTDIMISIFRENSIWNLWVRDVESGASVESAFSGGQAQSLKSGDQEVFALESYSRSASTFREMGNLTLQGLFVNGERVAGGFYSYTGWAMVHNPVFAVGSSGTNPPGFISVVKGTGGSIVWRYDAVWQSSGNSFPGTEAGLGALAVVSVSLLVAVLWIMRRTRTLRPGLARAERSPSGGQSLFLVTAVLPSHVSQTHP